MKKSKTNIYYAKPNTIVYFLNILNGEKLVNTGDLGNELSLYPINHPEKNIIFLYKTDELAWGENHFFAHNRGGLYIFVYLPGQDSMFGIYGDDIEKKEFDAAGFSAKGNNIHLS